MVLPCAPLRAQRASLLGDVQAGFGGFAWGATFEQITAARGTPAVDTVVRDYRRLVYHDTVDVTPTEIWYLLHPSRGLMAGQLGVEKPFQKCQDRFKQVREQVERANSALKKTHELKGEMDVVCTEEMGARIGGWQLWWGDSGAARITQSMMSGAANIIVYYRSPGADAYAAEQFAKRGPMLERFATFAWGTPRDSIVKRLGAPKSVDSTGELVSLRYFDMVLGERAIVDFTVSRTDGLIKGTYWVPVPTGRDCSLFYRKFHFALLERFPDVTPKVVRQPAVNKPFCQGVADGTAMVMAMWKDPKSDAYVSADFVKPGKHVKLMYVGALYATWAKRQREAFVNDKP